MRLHTQGRSAAVGSRLALALLAIASVACARSTAEPGSAPEGVGELRPSEEALRKRLSSLEYEVTQEEGTEPAFENAYWDEKRPGIYVDVVSGEPLFSSKHKFESGTGWPSFTQPLEPENVYTREDRSWGMVRTEARSRGADSHLGHVFQDGPGPRGERWCVNSAALRFVPASELEEEGYGEYRSLFEDASDEDEAASGSAP